MVHFGMIQWKYGTLEFGLLCYGALSYIKTRHGMLWHNVGRYSDTMVHSMVCHLWCVMVHYQWYGI